MISKHVEEILSLFRENYRIIHCAESESGEAKKIEIETSDLYPENELDPIFALSNNKTLNGVDFEFAKIQNINGHTVIFLGDYRFYFNSKVFGLQ